LRLDAQGAGLGLPGRIVEGVLPEGVFFASLIWTGSEFALTYRGSAEGGSDVFLAHGLFGTCPD
jgi:hypothetical protein